MLKYLPNMLACHISILNDCQGPSNTITEGEAASNLAIGEAFRIIRRGQADVMVTGGADSKIHPLSFVRMKLNGLYNPLGRRPGRRLPPVRRPPLRRRPGRGGRHPDPRGATSTPGAAGRDLRRDPRLRLGLRRQARRRPRPRGPRHRAGRPRRPPRRRPRPGRARPRQRPRARRPSSRDLAEARAYAPALRPATVPVVGLKGYTGNTASGCGAVELIASLLAVHAGLLPATLNCDEPDPEIDLDVVRGGAAAARQPVLPERQLHPIRPGRGPGRPRRRPGGCADRPDRLPTAARDRPRRRPTLPEDLIHESSRRRHRDGHGDPRGPRPGVELEGPARGQERRRPDLAVRRPHASRPRSPPRSRTSAWPTTSPTPTAGPSTRRNTKFALAAAHDGDRRLRPATTASASTPAASASTSARARGSRTSPGSSTSSTAPASGTNRVDTAEFVRQGVDQLHPIHEAEQEPGTPAAPPGQLLRRPGARTPAA